MLAGFRSPAMQRRSRPDLSRSERTSPQREWARMAAFERGCFSAAGAVPRPLRSGAIDPASRVSPPDNRSAIARDRRRRLDLDTAPAAHTHPGRIALRSRLPRRPPRPRRAAEPVKLPTGKRGTLRVELVSKPRAGYMPARKVVSAGRASSPAPGSRGPSVVALERRLSQLHYALRAVDGYYGTRHVRSGARVPEGQRAASDRPCRAVALAAPRTSRCAPCLPRR